MFALFVFPMLLCLLFDMIPSRGGQNSLNIHVLFSFLDFSPCVFFYFSFFDMVKLVGVLVRPP